MFKETVVASKLREKMAHYFEMVTGNTVLQILHRGGEVKVLMTQEHYLGLVSKLAMYEKMDDAVVESKSVEQLTEIVAQKMRAFEDEKELRDGESSVEKVRRG